jgi:hypothetical protein
MVIQRRLRPHPKRRHLLLGPRRLGDGIEALPWQVCLERVWDWRE